MCMNFYYNRASKILVLLLVVFLVGITHTAVAATCIAYAMDGSGACVKYADETVTPSILDSGSQAKGPTGGVCISYATDGSGACVKYAEETVTPSILKSETGTKKTSGPTNVSAPKDLKGLVGIITNIIGTVIILVFGLTFLAIMWGTIKGWVINGESGEGVESGKKFVTVGIIALVVMSSLWGILHILQASFFGG